MRDDDDDDNDVDMNLEEEEDFERFDEEDSLEGNEIDDY